MQLLIVKKYFLLKNSINIQHKKLSTIIQVIFKGKIKHWKQNKTIHPNVFTLKIHYTVKNFVLEKNGS